MCYSSSIKLSKFKHNPERVTNIKKFINKYNWKDIEFQSNKKYWKMFESNNKIIAINVLYISHNSEEIRHAYKSKHNFNDKNQVILLIITDGKKWHYLAVKCLSALLRKITSTNYGGFYFLNCLHSFRTESKLENHKNVCKNHDNCYIEMPKEDTKILKYNHREKSMKAPFIIYSDLESLLERINNCYNNPEKSSTVKINLHTACGYSLFTHCTFDTTKNKLNYYRGHDCMKMFCKDLREHAMKIINFEKKEMKPLTYEENESYLKQEVCHICKKEFITDIENSNENMFIKYRKYRGVAHSICNLRYKTLNEIPIVFHNGSKYDFHFIIKKLAKKCDG